MPFKDKTLVYGYIFTVKQKPPSKTSVADIIITISSIIKENIKEINIG